MDIMIDLNRIKVLCLNCGDYVKPNYVDTYDILECPICGAILAKEVVK